MGTCGNGGFMKKWMLFLFFAFLAAEVYANPSVHPSSHLAHLLVAGASIGVEVCLVTLLLVFFNLLPKPVYLELFVGNMAVYFMFFLPFLERVSLLWAGELLVVTLDGLLIKIISNLAGSQGDSFIPLKWRYIFVISALGNFVSYCTGLAFVMN